MAIGIFFQAGYIPPAVVQPVVERNSSQVLDVQPMVEVVAQPLHRHYNHGSSLKGEIIQVPPRVEAYSVQGRAQTTIKAGQYIDVFA